MDTRLDALHVHSHFVGIGRRFKYAVDVGGRVVERVRATAVYFTGVFAQHTLSTTLKTASKGFEGVQGEAVLAGAE